MVRFVELGHPRVVPVDGQKVLGQVVGSDADEVHLLHQLVEDEQDRGHLDHRPERQALGDLVALVGKLQPHAVEDRAHGVHFVE